MNVFQKNWSVCDIYTRNLNFKFDLNNITSTFRFDIATNCNYFFTLGMIFDILLLLLLMLIFMDCLPCYKAYVQCLHWYNNRFSYLILTLSKKYSFIAVLYAMKTKVQFNILFQVKSLDVSEFRFKARESHSRAHCY